MYSDPTMWNLIFQRNQSYIEDPDQIFAGQIIIIPKDIRDPMERVTVMSPKKNIPEGNEPLYSEDIGAISELRGTYQMTDGSNVQIVWKFVTGTKNKHLTAEGTDNGTQVLSVTEGYQITNYYIINNGTTKTRTAEVIVTPLYFPHDNENQTDPSNEYFYMKNPDPQANTICYDWPQDYDYQNLSGDRISVTSIMKIINLETGGYFEEKGKNHYLQK